MTFNSPGISEFLLIMNCDYFAPISFTLIDITLQYALKKIPFIYKVMTFEASDMTLKASEKNGILFYFVR